MDELKGIHVLIPKDLHKAVKTLAAQENTQVKTLVISALYKLINDNKNNVI